MSPLTTPSNLEELLQDLRREHPPRTLERGGITWRYTAVGEGPEGLLLLPGMTGTGEAYLPLVPRLAEHFRMVMVAYPPVSGLDEMLDGLAALLEREGLTRTALIGGSFGGMVAQGFLHRFPEKTSQLVLSATAPPAPERAASNERWMRIMGFLPISLFRGLLRLVVRKLMKPVEVEKAFWQSFYSDAIGDLGKQDLLARYRVSIDFDRRGVADPNALAGSEILILEGGDDQLAKDDVRQAMRVAYPQARFHTFEGAGHGISLERPEEWATVVRDFLVG